jgi:hypothetical protein
MFNQLKDFTGWTYYTGMDGVTLIGIAITNSDGSSESRSLQDEEVAEWIAAGNTPLSANKDK